MYNQSNVFRVGKYYVLKMMVYVLYFNWNFYYKKSELSDRIKFFYCRKHIFIGKKSHKKINRAGKLLIDAIKYSYS